MTVTNKTNNGQVQWLLPVFLAPQKVEIGRTWLQATLRQKVYKTPSQPIKVVHTTSQQLRKSINSRIAVQADLGINLRPYGKNNYKKNMGWGVAQVVEHLHSKGKTLSSNSSTSKKERRKTTNAGKDVRGREETSHTVGGNVNSGGSSKH
jgi:hypothetical protein